MEIVRQSRGRSRGQRNLGGSRGTTNRVSTSLRGRGRGRTPHVVPMGNYFVPMQDSYTNTKLNFILYLFFLSS